MKERLSVLLYRILSAAIIAGILGAGVIFFVFFWGAGT